MPTPVQITFRGLDPSPAIEAYVRKRAVKLSTFSDRITHCRVAVEAPHHHQQHGRTYRVRVDLNVPGAELVVARDNGDDSAHRDVYAAIDDTFDSAGRVLQDHVRRQRGNTKVHENRD